MLGLVAHWRRLVRERNDLLARVADLETKLEAERTRHRRREDELVDRVLTATGRAPLTPDPKPPKPRPAPETEPLNAVEEARLVALREAAVKAGRSVQDADRYFYAQRAGQPPPFRVPEEPFIAGN